MSYCTDSYKQNKNEDKRNFNGVIVKKLLVIILCHEFVQRPVCYLLHLREAGGKF
jgi:hypothetical protein